MENRSHALMAGLFTILFLLAAALALWWFTGSREPTNTYLLETRGSVTGLNIEAPVRYRGIRAGKVKDILPDEDDPGLLLVEITLDRQYRLTGNTVAKLNYQGVTGLAYVMLEDGKRGGQPLDTAGPLPPRLKIQPGLLSTLDDKAVEIAAQLADITTRINRLLDDRNLQNISRTLDNLAGASDGLKDLPQVMAGLRSALSDTNLLRLQNLLVHLEKTAGAAAPLTAEARALVATMNALAKRFDRVAGSAIEVSDRLGADTLPRVETLMTELTVATRRLDRLLDTLGENPQAVIFGPATAKPGPGEAGFVP
ncbi:MAG: MCE family protein [Gammaproteobacteria bacterium]|nr:MCE family protein [Rhodocyclaceae bacterium]MBU3909829.1 MCE family protein [Gammaproteobacteria bacterium]MBU3988069.1 MCE family protein [Gammaproteobacteria bacterium]MBU4003592.1 MCE family protein [Gammaproteobacteria bacterium]MBU4020049.1 MCE family protein [Gammaproteobacteria bacterium]